MNRRFFKSARYCSMACLWGLALAPAQVSGDPPSASQSKADEGAVTLIRAYVARVDRQIKTVRKVTRDLQDLTKETGDLTGYFKGNDLIKIEAKYFRDGDQESDEFYLQRGQVVFGLRTDYVYVSHVNSRISRIDQERYYWDNNRRLVRVIENKKQLPVDAPETRRRANQFTALIPRFTALLRDPKGKKSNYR